MGFNTPRIRNLKKIWNPTTEQWEFPPTEGPVIDVETDEIIIPEGSDLSNYYTRAEVDALIAAIMTGGGGGGESGNCCCPPSSGIWWRSKRTYSSYSFTSTSQTDINAHLQSLADLGYSIVAYLFFGVRHGTLTEVLATQNLTVVGSWNFLSNEDCSNDSERTTIMNMNNNTNVQDAVFSIIDIIASSGGSESTNPLGGLRNLRVNYTDQTVIEFTRTDPNFQEFN